MLRIVDWKLVTDVSGQFLGPIVKDQDKTINCPERSANNYHYTLRNIPVYGNSSSSTGDIFISVLVL